MYRPSFYLQLTISTLTTLAIALSAGEGKAALGVQSPIASDSSPQVIAPFSIAQMSTQQVLEVLSQGIKKEPRNPKLYLARGVFRANKMDDYAGAIEDFTKTIELDPKNAEAYFKRGAARSNLKDGKGTVADFEVAEKLFQQQGNTERVKLIQNLLKQMRGF
jgi:tetratricopeptide (TPR) repeat protein